ncbi:uncharacterized protein LOC114331319 [Diabrotica virgifera virgifera]|uniref:Chitin-binding type-2 domain-containing protein n=1 Tax=Diabrotica virgifera virgifera TaxID=50390 RepID=A0ABM5IMR3_DIAVI|nr:uncharacterized protein LOC114331319 [Diabrotica virgifera virgifera]
MNKVPVLRIFISAVIFLIFGTNECESQCTQQGSFPSENGNCLSYYTCVVRNGQWVRSNHTCPIGRPFNSSVAICDFTATCSTTTDSSTTDSTTAETTEATTIETTAATTTATATTKTAQCPPLGIYSLNSADCRSYYRCSYYNGKYLLNNYRCPVGRPFNSATQICDSSLAC